MATWDEVVSLCETELPEVERSTSYGTPALKVRKKLFARLKESGEQLVVFVDFMEREALTQENPDVYVVTDHYRDYPMMLVELEAVDDDELRELLIESWRRRVPKKLLAEFDGD
ncbi:MAG TPA: MmcQ/YjbR family DNA-binding protein [Solirubrobacterales bacterium]|nr:MmcQ/YjbR family DNA-binding protein [Solirubrobacterales bacterium]